MRKRPQRKVYAIFTCDEVAHALFNTYPERVKTVPQTYNMRFGRDEGWTISMMDPE